MFVITLMKGIELHPMNYVFLAAAFFAFHLLFAYTVHHVDVTAAFAFSSASPWRWWSATCALWWA